MGDKMFGITLISVLVCLFVTLVLLLVMYGTKEYDCLLFDAAEEDLFDVHQRVGEEARVWIKETVPLGQNMWHLEVVARSRNGINDIDKLLSERLGLKYYCLD